ncbi:hypothetical protein ACWGIR_24960, partial [Streptomyces albidoflavus]
GGGGGGGRPRARRGPPPAGGGGRGARAPPHPLRLPAHLKARAEEAATTEGLSVNAWLVRAVSAAVDGGTAPARPAPGTRTSRAGGQSFTGWAR